MKLLSTTYISDGAACHRGMKANVVKVESQEDYDHIWATIASTSYYDGAYFDAVTGRSVNGTNLAVAAIAASLNPARALEVGCGTGKDLFLVHLAGGVDVTGIDFSPAAATSAPAPLRDKILIGDFMDVGAKLVAQGAKFDTILGFDIWEHLQPKLLDKAIDTLLSVADEDAFFLFVIPGFGHDRVFGEIFPLELEENRAAFDERRPFDHLTLSSVDPAIPSSGHLTWAHTEWWEKRFREHGMTRAVEVEQRLQRAFGPWLHYARRSFYLFRRNTETACAREQALLGAQKTTLLRAFGVTSKIYGRLKGWEEENRVSISDHSEMEKILDGMKKFIQVAFYERTLNPAYRVVDFAADNAIKLVVNLAGLFRHWGKRSANVVCRFIAWISTLVATTVLRK